LRRDWLLLVTRLADPDPWRDRVRNAPLYWDLENLKELTRTAPVEGQSVQLLVALGERLHTADPKSALTFLRRVQQAYPDDFFANFWAGYAEEPIMAVGYNRVAQAIRPNTIVANRNLADSLLGLGRTEEALPYFRRILVIDPKDVQCRTALAESSVKVAISHGERARALQQQRQWAEAIVHYRAALDLVPDWASAHYDLAMALNSPSHRDEAVEELRKTLALDPHYPAARANLGLILIDHGKLDQAVVELRQAVKLNPPDPRAQAGLRRALARLGRFEELHAAWREELKSAPPDHDARFGYAELCLFLRDEQEYRRERRELLARFSSVSDPIVAERIGRSCLLLPPSDDELRQAVALTDRAVAAGRSGRDKAYPYFLFAQGLARYRVGRFDDAIKLMNGEAKRVMGPSPQLILAMAQFRSGQTGEAQKTLTAAIQSYDWSESKATSHEAWITHILRREAESLIGLDRPTEATAAGSSISRLFAEL
jgi:serine/threonine-protein kinase